MPARDGRTGPRRAGSASRRSISARQPGQSTYRRLLVKSVVWPGAPQSEVSGADPRAQIGLARKVSASDSTAEMMTPPAPLSLPLPRSLALMLGTMAAR